MDRRTRVSPAGPGPGPRCSSGALTASPAPSARQTLLAPRRRSGSPSGVCGEKIWIDWSGLFLLAAALLMLRWTAPCPAGGAGRCGRCQTCLPFTPRRHRRRSAGKTGSAAVAARRNAAVLAGQRSQISPSPRREIRLTPTPERRLRCHWTSMATQTDSHIPDAWERAPSGQGRV